MLIEKGRHMSIYYVVLYIKFQKMQLIYSVRKQTSSCLGTGISGWMEKEGQVIKGHKETLGVMDMFIILIVVMISWIYTYSKTLRIIHVGSQLNTVVCQLCFNIIITIKAFTDVRAPESQQNLSPPHWSTNLPTWFPCLLLFQSNQLMTLRLAIQQMNVIAMECPDSPGPLALYF